MKNWLLLGVLTSALAVSSTPAHAKGIGIIGDLWQLGQNVVDGTIPLPYVLGFVGLIVAIGVLGFFEARKNARKAAEEEASQPAGIDLSK